MADNFLNIIMCGAFLLFSSFVLRTISGNVELPTVSTKNVTAHYCPFPCTVGNQTLCYPPPCPPPACVDPAKYKPTDCCDYCPHGPNCRGPNGTLIKYDHWRIIDGKNCTCKYIAQAATCV